MSLDILEAGSQVPSRGEAHCRSPLKKTETCVLLAASKIGFEDTVFTDAGFSDISYAYVTPRTLLGTLENTAYGTHVEFEITSLTAPKARQLVTQFTGLMNQCC